jgi:hypothetical protein
MFKNGTFVHTLIDIKEDVMYLANSKKGTYGRAYEFGRWQR